MKCAARKTAHEHLICLSMASQHASLCQTLRKSAPWSIFGPISALDSTEKGPKNDPFLTGCHGSPSKRSAPCDNSKDAAESWLSNACLIESVGLKMAAVEAF